MLVCAETLAVSQLFGAVGDISSIWARETDGCPPLQGWGMPARDAAAVADD